MSNTSIRQAAKTSHVPLWRLADSLHISEATLTRKLRHELPDDEKAHIMEIIHQLAKAS